MGSGSAAPSPHLTVSFAIAALDVQQQFSFALQLDRQSGPSKLAQIVTLVQDVFSDLAAEDCFEGALDVDITNEKLKGLQSKAAHDLAEWHRRLKLADEEDAKVEQAKVVMNTMRAAYFKELAHLREQLHQKEIAETSNSQFQLMDLTLFDPVDYTFEEETRQIVQQKLQLLKRELEAQHQEILVRQSDKVNALTTKLETTRLLLERKDRLLRKSMQEHGYDSESALDKALAHQRTVDIQARGPLQHQQSTKSIWSGDRTHSRKKSRAWTLFSRTQSRADSKPERSESRTKSSSKLVQMTSNLAGSLLRTVGRSQSRLEQQNGSQFFDDRRVEVADSEERLGSSSQDISANCRSAHSKLRFEQSVQSDIDGCVIEKALADYFQKHSEDRWSHLLGDLQCEKHACDHSRPESEEHLKSISVEVQTTPTATCRCIGVQATDAGACQIQGHVEPLNDVAGCQMQGMEQQEPLNDVAGCQMQGMEQQEQSTTDPSCFDLGPESCAANSAESCADGITNILQRHGVRVDSHEMTPVACSAPSPSPSARRKSCSETKTSTCSMTRRRLSAIGSLQKPVYKGLAPESLDMPLVIKAPVPGEVTPAASPMGSFVTKKNKSSHRHAA